MGSLMPVKVSGKPPVYASIAAEGGRRPPHMNSIVERSTHMSRHSSPSGKVAGPNTKCSTRLGVATVAFCYIEVPSDATASAPVFGTTPAVACSLRLASKNQIAPSGTDTEIIRGPKKS